MTIIGTTHHRQTQLGVHAEIAEHHIELKQQLRAIRKKGQKQ